MNTNSTHSQKDIISILENLPEVKNWKWKEESKTRVTISLSESKWIELRLTDTTLSIESGATVYPRRRIDTTIDVTDLTHEQIASNLRKILKDHGWLEDPKKEEEAIASDFDFTDLVVQLRLHTRINWQITALSKNIATLSPSLSLGDWWNIQVVLFPSSLRLMNAEYYFSEVPSLDYRFHFEGSNPEGVAAREISHILYDKWIAAYFWAIKEAENQAATSKRQDGLKAIADAVGVKPQDPDKLAIMADSQLWTIELFPDGSHPRRFTTGLDGSLVGKFGVELVLTTPEEVLELIEWVKAKEWIKNAIALS